jgi:hypothetical protein
MMEVRFMAKQRVSGRQNKKAPGETPKGLWSTPGSPLASLDLNYLVGVAEEAAGAGTAFLVFFDFLVFLLLCISFTTGVDAGAAPCAKTMPVVLPKNRTAIKTANDFFMDFLQTLSGLFELGDLIPC